jgi:hypothetical protein
VWYRKELVVLGIFVTLLVLIDDRPSLAKPFCPENGVPMEKSNSIFQNETSGCLLRQTAIQAHNRRAFKGRLSGSGAGDQCIAKTFTSENCQPFGLLSFDLRAKQDPSPLAYMEDY